MDSWNTVGFLFLSFLADSPVHVTNKDDVVPFVEGHFPRELEDHSDVAVFGLFSSEHQQG